MSTISNQMMMTSMLAHVEWHLEGGVIGITPSQASLCILHHWINTFHSCYWCLAPFPMLWHGMMSDWSNALLWVHRECPPMEYSFADEIPVPLILYTNSKCLYKWVLVWWEILLDNCAIQCSICCFLILATCAMMLLVCSIQLISLSSIPNSNIR